MKKLLVPFIILCTFFLISCSDDEQGFKLSDTAEACDNPELTNPDFTGVSCCITRSDKLVLNSVIEYEYKTSIKDAKYTWIIEGDISVVSNNNSNKISVKLNDNFTAGYIACSGSSKDDRRRCGVSVTITKE